MVICPYMGSVWDAETPYAVPDSANRCFARSKPVRIFLLFSKEHPGVRIAINDQHTDCYGDFRQCDSFLVKEASQEATGAAARSDN